jgi:hypothetical protein
VVLIVAVWPRCDPATADDKRRRRRREDFVDAVAGDAVVARRAAGFWMLISTSVPMSTPAMPAAVCWS